MTNDPLTGISTRSTPQSQPIPGRDDMVRNSAGGFTWTLDDWAQLRRFLILGTQGGTYYVSEKDLTRQNAEVVIRCVKADGRRVVALITEVSLQNLAPKVQPTIFALAVAAGEGDDVTRRAALDALTSVCRTGYHLFLFARYVEQFRGWGRGLRRAVARWYTERPVSGSDETRTSPLDLQVVKYRQREGWSHRDLLRLAHPVTDDEAKNAVFKYVVDRDEVDIHELPLPELIRASEEVLKETDPKAVAAMVDRYNLPWEVLPSEVLKSPVVWEALLPRMGLTALIRNLGRMSAIGLLTPMSDAQRVVIDRIGDQDALRRSRVHPFSVLLALSTYTAGRGVKGSLTWTPAPKVGDALDAAFYLAFGNVVPSGKNTLIGLDVSGSMTWAGIAGTHLTPNVAAAAMCLITAAVEESCEIMAFAGEFRKLDISPRMRLDDVVRRTNAMSFGRTDCSLPMQYALQHKMPVDTFVVYTDSETWAGHIQPSQALQQFRREMGRDGRLVVVGMVANRFTIADPQDAGMLDVVGFDASAPQLISDFSAGRV